MLSPVEPLTTPFDKEGLEDIGFMTCMALTLLGNYAQTGHFGGPLAYTPYNVAAHLAGPTWIAASAGIPGLSDGVSQLSAQWLLTPTGL